MSDALREWIERLRDENMRLAVSPEGDEREEIRNQGAEMMASQMRKAATTGGRFSDPNANWCLDQIARLRRVVEAAGPLLEAFSEQWCREHAVNDHICDMDHKDEMEVADGVQAIRAALAEADAGEDR